MSDSLAMHRSELVADPMELSSIRNDLEELLSQVLAADLDAAVATVLCRHLHEMIASIDEYRITGVVSIQDAVVRFIGDLELRLATDQYPTEKDGGFGKRVWEVAQRLAIVAGLASGTAQLTTVVMAALEAGPHH